MSIQYNTIIYLNYVVLVYYVSKTNSKEISNLLKLYKRPLQTIWRLLNKCYLLNFQSHEVSAGHRSAGPLLFVKSDFGINRVKAHLCTTLIVDIAFSGIINAYITYSKAQNQNLLESRKNVCSVDTFYFTFCEKTTTNKWITLSSKISSQNLFKVEPSYSELFNC